MSYRKLKPLYDGAQGPIYEIRPDLGLNFDASHAAIVFYIQDRDGNTVGTRPGVIADTKADKHYHFLMKGKESDWDGLGKDLFVIPRVYAAMAPDRTPATNLLTNSSFDTYTGGSGVADGWTISGTQGSIVFDVRQDDPAPPVIFGKAQRYYISAGGNSAYLTQLRSVSLVAGDWVSAGVWRRAKLDAGAGLIGEPGYFLRLIDTQSVKSYLPIGDTDWTFDTIAMQLTASHSQMAFQIAAYDAVGYDLRFDDAFLFKGQWSVYHLETFELPVKARPRPSKTNFSNTNFIAGFGGFEADSNADGVADRWGKIGTLTYSMESDPDDVNVGLGGKKAQKVVLAGSTTDYLVILYRANFLAGQTWRFQVAYKNSGALSGSPANGDFGVVLETEPFDGTFEQSSLSGANFTLGSQATYTTKFRTLTLAANHSVLVCKINLKTASGGTLWLDDAQLLRTA